MIVTTIKTWFRWSTREWVAEFSVSYGGAYRTYINAGSDKDATMSLSSARRNRVINND